MEDKTVETLLGRLRGLRQRKGLTQEEFAERSGISYKYYQAVEAGRKRDLRLSTIIRLAEAHGLEPWQLLQSGGEDAPTPKKRARSSRKKP